MFYVQRERYVWSPWAPGPAESGPISKGRGQPATLVIYVSRPALKDEAGAVHTVRRANSPTRRRWLKGQKAHCPYFHFICLFSVFFWLYTFETDTFDLTLNPSSCQIHWGTVVAWQHMQVFFQCKKIKIKITLCTDHHPSLHFSALSPLSLSLTLSLYSPLCLLPGTHTLNSVKVAALFVHTITSSSWCLFSPGMSQITDGAAGLLVNTRPQGLQDEWTPVQLTVARRGHYVRVPSTGEGHGLLWIWPLNKACLGLLVLGSNGLKCFI